MVTRVLVTGSINRDHVLRLPRMPAEHEKIRASAAIRCLGGSAANTATWLASDRGLAVSMVGVVGDDEAGAQCRGWLAAAGVETSDVRVAKQWTTPEAWCWSDGHTKWIVTSASDVTPSLDPDDTPFAAEHFSHAHISSRVDPRVLATIMEARIAGATVSVELNGKAMDEVRQVADLVFLNSRELAARFHMSIGGLDPVAASHIAPHPGAFVVVTDEDRLVVAASASNIVRVPVLPLAMITDRTGAGDAFNAGYLIAWLGNEDTEACLRSGLAMARAALSRLGGSYQP